MRLTTIVGALLIVVGGVALYFGGIPYTERESIELGPIEASADVERQADLPPLAAGGILALGVGLVVYGATRRS